MTLSGRLRVALAVCCALVATAVPVTAALHSPVLRTTAVSALQLELVPVQDAFATHGWWEIKNGAHELCLDAVASGDGTNGDPVQLWKCNGTANQLWYMNGCCSTIINKAHGLCLDGDKNHIGNGDKVQLWRCIPGALNQWWNITGDFHLRFNANQAYCLDAVKSGDGTNGDRVQLWQCLSEPGNYQQVW